MVVPQPRDSLTSGQLPFMFAAQAVGADGAHAAPAPSPTLAETLALQSAPAGEPSSDAGEQQQQPRQKMSCDSCQELRLCQPGGYDPVSDATYDMVCNQCKRCLNDGVQKWQQAEQEASEFAQPGSLSAPAADAQPMPPPSKGRKRRLSSGRGVKKVQPLDRVDSFLKFQTAAIFYFVPALESPMLPGNFALAVIRIRFANMESPSPQGLPRSSRRAPGLPMGTPNAPPGFPKDFQRHPWDPPELH